MYKTDLEKDIVSDTSGDFRKLMVALAKVGFRFVSLPLLPPRASCIPHFILGSELTQSLGLHQQSQLYFDTGFALSTAELSVCIIGYFLSCKTVWAGGLWGQRRKRQLLAPGLDFCASLVTRGKSFCLSLSSHRAQWEVTLLFLSPVITS